MAFQTKVYFNIDKLKITLYQQEGLFSFFEKVARSDNKYIDYDGFQLLIMDNISPERIKPLTQLSARVMVGDNGEQIALGTFTFFNNARYETHEKEGYDSYCFFEFENSAFYRQMGCYPVSNGETERYNYVSLFPFIAESIGLQIRNICTLHVACDCNVNVIKRLRQTISDVEGYKLFLQGREVKDKKERLDVYKEFFGRTRERIDRTPTVYIGEEKTGGMTLYDKSKEIAEASQKHYVENYNNFGSCTTHRIEVKAKKEQFDQWLNHLNKIFYEDYTDKTLVFTQEYLCKFWLYFANRLIYFVEKKTNKKVDLLDLISPL